MLTPIGGPLRHGIDAPLDALAPPSFAARLRNSFHQSSIKLGQQVYFGRNNVVTSTRFPKPWLCLKLHRRVPGAVHENPAYSTDIAAQDPTVRSLPRRPTVLRGG